MTKLTRSNRVLLIITACCFVVVGIAASSQPALSQKNNVTTTAAAASPRVVDNVPDTVYVTRTGKKYHRKDCRWAKDGIAMPLSEVANKYTPCSICLPPKAGEAHQYKHVIPSQPRVMREDPAPSVPDSTPEVRQQAPELAIPPVVVQEAPKPAVVVEEPQAAPERPREAAKTPAKSTKSPPPATKSAKTTYSSHPRPPQSMESNGRGRWRRR